VSNTRSLRPTDRAAAMLEGVKKDAECRYLVDGRIRGSLVNEFA
jgi:hypothetical protein